MRDIKFRGKRKDNNQWVTGCLLIEEPPLQCFASENTEPDKYLIGKSGFADWNMTRPFTAAEVYPESAGQFIGIKARNGKDIFEGDVVQYKIPYRTTQTHTGDNIPNGSYTEPMEPGIKVILGVVEFKDGSFILNTEDKVDDFPTPISWHQTQWDLESIKEAISWTRQDAGWFYDPEEGDLQYLITECAKVENSEKLIEYLNGFEIIGNLFDNPELFA